MPQPLQGELLSALFLKPTDTIHRALSVMSETSAQIALVLEPDTRALIAMVTDGDIRRALLKNASLKDSVESVMNREFSSVKTQDMPNTNPVALLRAKGIRHLPEVDTDGRVIALHTTFPVAGATKQNIPVVIMAGGLGSRLRPLTDDCPKPLLELGGKPILERILLSLITQGFRTFYFSVNYRANMIEDYFGNGAKWGADIHYLHETKKLGTAGALGEITGDLETPFIVQNGDLITDFAYADLIETHKSKGAVATMGLRNIYTQIEFGVVESQDGAIQTITEKPTLEHQVNAGIYCLSPSVLSRVKRGRYLDMPTLFMDLIEDNEPCAGFTIPGTWLDIGTLPELERARARFES
jgi:dTDP-glucose pyrophosphorylase